MLVKDCGCKEPNAKRRIVQYHDSDKGEGAYKLLMAKAVKYTGASKVSVRGVASKKERDAIDRIPDAGSWEKANLNPCSFVDRGSVQANY